jgi:hypothetical protein
MIECGLLDKINGRIYVHDWLDYAGKYLREYKYRRKPEKWHEIDNLHKRLKQLYMTQHQTIDDTVPNRTVPNQVHKKPIRERARSSASEDSVRFLNSGKEKTPEMPQVQSKLDETGKDTTDPIKMQPTPKCGETAGICGKQSGAKSDSVRFFSCPGLGKIFEKCGWKSALDIDKAVDTVGRKGKSVSVEWFLACVVEKFEAKLERPAGAAIAAFAKGWTPTDQATRRLRELAFPPEPRSASPQLDPDPDYILACNAFKAGKLSWEKLGIHDAKELLRHPDFQKALAEKKARK